jgi:signal transduction histidine kinase
MPSLRLLPLLYTATYLGLLIDTTPSPADWTVATGSALLVLGGGRLPLAVLLGQLALVLAAAQYAMVATNLVPGFAALALGELVLRRRGVVLWAGIAVAVTFAAVVLFRPGDPVSWLVRIGLVIGVPILVAEYLRAQRKIATQAAERVTEAQRLRASETRAARVGERAAIARELHDLVAHHVSSMVLRTGVARHVAKDSEVIDVLDDVHATGTAALADLRRLVAVLRDPDVADGPAMVQPEDLVTELELAVDRVRQAGRTVRAEVDPRVAGLDVLRRLVVLRIVQEGLTNVLKHANPSAEVRVGVEVGADTTAVVEIADTGGRPVVPDTESGHGLPGMRERVELVGGEFAAGPTGEGWRVRAVLPVVREPS